jgi:hypothetical protein
VLEDRTLCDADLRGDVGGSDQRWADLARQTQGGLDDLDLALFGGETDLHRGWQAW